jgi:flagellar FliL protein
VSTAAPAEPEVKPKKGKKTLVIIVLAVVVLVAGAAGAWFFMKGKSADHEEEHVKVEPVRAPSYLPMESMTVNLADPGGDRFAQLGITVELTDDKAADRIKGYLPSIRNAVLLIVSQRTTEELLTRRGKEKLARDIAVEVARPLGFADEMIAAAKQADAQAKRADAAAAQAAAAAASAPATTGSAGEVEDAPAPRDEGKKAEARKPNPKEGGNPVRGVLFSSFIIQ